VSSIIVLGGSGFVGRSFITGRATEVPIKAVSRHTPTNTSLLKRAQWFSADMAEINSLDPIVTEGDIVINLIFSSGEYEENSQVLKNVINTCLRKKVKRLIHCSTATVVGRSKDDIIDESTVCMPVTAYEKSKYLLEQQVLMSATADFEVVIVRPTAIIGPGGKNLMKLAVNLKNSFSLINHLNAYLNGRRPMHLVPVDMVTAALEHLIFLKKPLGREVFIISADEDLSNNYISVEYYLMNALGLKTRSAPLFTIHPWLLSVLLKLRGRSDTNIHREYSSKKLLSTGFTFRTQLKDAVEAFGKSL